MLVGQYKGKFPIKLQVNGLMRGKAYSNQVEYQAIDAYKENSILERHWWGQFILSNEGSYQTQIISEVVEASTKYRILSNYTAFLCLEPSLGGTVCKDCVDGIPYTSGDNNYGAIAAINEEDSLSVQVIAYPNPAKEHITFSIQNKKLEIITIKIYNSTGAIVKEVQLTDRIKNATFEWNLEDENGFKVGPGLYFVKIEVGKTSKNIKIVVE